MHATAACLTHSFGCGPDATSGCALGHQALAFLLLQSWGWDAGTSEKTAVGHRKERKQEGGLVAVVGLTQGRNRKQKSRDCGGCGEWTVPLGAP